MARPVTLFTGQWADLPLETVAQKAAEFGYDGLELACWGDHFEVDKAMESDSYIQGRWDILNKYGLKCWAISCHLTGQAVADDPIDARHQGTLPPRIWGDGKPEGVRQRAAEEIKNTARAAAKFGVKVVPGFTGSPIWKYLYFFPPTSDEMIQAGYKEFADRWNPILDVFDEVGVKFALEVHPTEIAYDIVTAKAALAAVGGREAFGFNFDPSHLLWQQVNPVRLIQEFPDRIYHVHIKDAAVTLDGTASILSSHLNFGQAGRGWDFRSPSHGDVNFEEIIRELNRINYQGPLSVEWEDSGMDREFGAAESAEFVHSIDFPASATVFDSAFGNK
jgi:sugar phosphate isomerase/epimerase